MSGKFNSNKPFVNRKLMHPRNIYQNKLDFALLANRYPEFRKIAKQDIRGKVTVDFKDEESLRILSKTLLKKDFDLNVNIPPGYLVPTISLRLNYILWLEDVLSIMQKSDEIFGIDIGTGASCVYMLLGAKKNSWNMIGTEIDADSVKYAKENIKNNNLGHLLKVVLTSNEEPLFNFLNDDKKEYHFCMCNPPFYSSDDDCDELSGKRRNINCPPPKNIQTGKNSELSTDGGEIEFITRIIMESLHWKTRIKVYTTMVGHKKNVFNLTRLLENKGIKKYVTTEFVQGNTSRWGIAWTFQDDINIEDIGTGVTPLGSVLHNKYKNKNERKPIIHQFSNPDKYPEKEMLLRHIRRLFAELKVVFVENHVKEHDSFEVTAYENTWSHQRQKRREMMRIQKQYAESSSTEEDININEFFSLQTSSSYNKRRTSEAHLNSPDIKKPRLESSNYSSREPLVKFEMIVKLHESSYYQLALIHLSGNKDAMYQVLQFLKNRFNQ